MSDPTPQEPSAAGPLTFRGAIKSFDVEDPVNIFVHRPIQLVIAKVLHPIGVTPNQATLLSLLASLGAAWAIVHGTTSSLLLAGALLFGSAIFDGVDGMLARARGVSSPAGHIFDGVADYIGNVATFGAGAWFLSARIGWLPAGLLALGAHVAWSYHVMIYDFYLTHYLRLGVRSRSGAGVLERAEALLEETRASGGSLFRRVVFRIYVWQLRNRERQVARLNPAAVLYTAMEPTVERAERYVRSHRWPMRLTSWLGNAPHMDIFALCVAFGRIDLYFLARIFGFSALAVGQVAWHQLVSARFLAEENEHAPVAGLGAFRERARATGVLMAIVCFVALWYVPALTTGYMLDDNALLIVLDEFPAMFWRDMNLFSMVSGPAHVEVLRQFGHIPWWSSPEFMINFWRPLPSLSHWIDFQLWGDDAVRSHAVSLVLYLVVILLVHRLFSRLASGRPLLALLATAVFAVNQCHVVPVQWIANRSEMIGSIFMITSLLAFMTYRESPTNPVTGSRKAGLEAAAVSLITLASALLSRETALALPLLFVAQEVFLSGEASGTLWARLRPRLPFLIAAFAIVSVFLAFYFLSGYGARSAYYINPVAVPAQWAANLLTSVYLNNALLITGLPLHLLGHTPIADYPIGAAVVGLVIVAFWWLACRWLGREPLFRFFVAWLIVMMVVFTTGYPDPRYLFIASMPFAWIAGRMIEVAWAKRRETRVHRVALAALVISHLVLAPVIVQASLQVIRTFDGKYEVLRESTRAAVDYDPLFQQPVEVFFLNWNQPEISVLFGSYLRRELPNVADDYTDIVSDERLSVVERQARGFARDRIHYYLLSMMDGSEHVSVVDDREIEIRASNGSQYFSTVYEELFTVGAPYSTGQSFETRAFRATVQEVDARGHILAVRFRFVHPLDSPQYRFMRWDGARFVKVHPGDMAASPPRAQH